MQERHEQEWQRECAWACLQRFYSSILIRERSGEARRRRSVERGESGYLWKTCIIVAFCAWVTCARVCSTSGRSSMLLAWSISLRRKAVWLSRISAFLRRLSLSARERWIFCANLLDLLEQAGGLGHVAGRILANAELGHLLDELGIEEALLARLGLVGPASRASMLCWSDGIAVGGGGAQRADGQAQYEDRGDRNHSPHRDLHMRCCPLRSCDYSRHILQRTASTKMQEF